MSPLSLLHSPPPKQGWVRQSLPCLEEMGEGKGEGAGWDWTSCSLGPCKEPKSQQDEVLCGPAMERGCPGLWRGTLVALYGVTAWASWHVFSASPPSLLTHLVLPFLPALFHEALPFLSWPFRPSKGASGALVPASAKAVES